MVGVFLQSFCGCVLLLYLSRILVSRGKNPTFLRVRTCFMSCPLTFLSTRFTPLEHLSTLAARRCAGRPNVYDKKWTLERDHYDKLCKRFSSRNRGHGSMFSQ